MGSLEKTPGCSSQATSCSPVRGRCNTTGVLYYTVVMKSTVQARLDVASRRDLAKLVRSLGWSPSEVVREALRRMASSQLPVERPRVAGMGKFCSGVSDLGSNKKHLRGFGG